MDDEIISQREFSRRLGVSEGTVRKAIEAGYIVEGRTTRTSGLPAIKYETALTEWNNSPAGLQAAEKKTIKPEATKKRTPVEKPAADPRPENKHQSPTPKAPAYDPELYASKKEILQDKQQAAKIRTQRDAIELQRLVGKLVDKDRVYNALFDYAKGIRENLATVPDRYLDDILNAPDRHTAHRILLTGINEALRALANPPELANTH